MAMLGNSSAPALTSHAPALKNYRLGKKDFEKERDKRWSASILEEIEEFRSSVASAGVSAHSSTDNKEKEEEKEKGSTPFPFTDDEILTAPTEIIVECVKNATKAHDVGHGGFCGDTRPVVVRVSENTVVKWAGHQSAEARNLEFVRRNVPSVRVPKLLRSVETKGGAVYIVQEYVRGTPLSDCWDDMSEDRRERICDQTVRYISDLQSLEVDLPGPIGGGMCDSPCCLFSLHGAGPFGSIQELERWYSRRADFCSRLKGSPPGEPSFEGAFGRRMVMSHLDIARRNIIVEEGDMVCLIDWEFAGAYPPWFERVTLKWTSHPDDFTRRVLERLPPHKEQIEKLERIRYALANCAGFI